VPYYEFCLIGGDGSRLSRERHPAADLETVWGRVFRMAELESTRGKQIHVLDDQGRIVIGIGAIAAALSAQRARAAQRCFDEARGHDRRTLGLCCRRPVQLAGGEHDAGRQ
jgi:hypothetical protein